MFGIPLWGHRFGRHWDGRDVGPCITRVASVGCPTSPLGRSSVGLSDNTSGRGVPVLAFKLAYVYSACRVLLPALGGATVEQITFGFRDICDCDSGGVRGAKTAQKSKSETSIFLAAPFDGVDRAPPQGRVSFLAISSSPLVPCGPADRRGAGTRCVACTVRYGSFYIYLSI